MICIVLHLNICYNQVYSWLNIISLIYFLLYIICHKPNLHFTFPYTVHVKKNRWSFYTKSLPGNSQYVPLISYQATQWGFKRWIHTSTQCSGGEQITVLIFNRPLEKLNDQMQLKRSNPYIRYKSMSYLIE